MNEQQREEIKKNVTENIDHIEQSLLDYLRENILTQIEGIEPSDLNAVDQALNTTLRLLTGDE
jgi:hypothetical protein